MSSHSAQSTKLDSTLDELVPVYVRNTFKKAIVLGLPRLVSLKVIKDRIHAKMKINPENQILFMEGKILHSEKIKLSKKSIIHVINTKRVNQDHITIKVRRLDEK